MTQGRLGTWLESTGYLGQPGRRAPLLTCHLPKPCQNPLAPRPSAPESNVGQAMHTDQSPCEVWRSSLTRTHPQPCWAEACVWHGCVLLSLRSAVDPSGHSEVKLKQAKAKQVRPKLVRWWGSALNTRTSTNRRIESAHTHTHTHRDTQTHTRKHQHMPHDIYWLRRGRVQSPGDF